MSKQVDERIVSMQFDNAHFEKNVSTSMSTIDKLKQKLKFDDSAKGFENISKSAKNVDMSTLSASVGTVASKFSTMEVVAITALANITNSAVNAGKNLVKSLTIDQVSSGWNKYEQKTASVQTLVNSTGKSVDEINKYLDKLMWYSDETSYGFIDMENALATMSSSGGDIDKLIPLIEGVANATAFAGKGAAEFSRAMQFGINQAYSKGYMLAQDWSTLETTTITSKQLKESLISAAENLGKIEKGSINLENFRESLKDKWLDTEVLEEGFAQFSKVTDEIYAGVESGIYENYADGLEQIGDKYGEVALRAAASSQEAKTFTEAIGATMDAVSSGWMKTFEILFGNYDEAKVLWTELANDLWEIFASGGETRNEFLTSVLGDRGSKWDQLLSKIEETGVSVSAFEEKFKEIARSHGIAIDDMIAEEGSLANVITSGKLKDLPNLVKETFKAFMEGGLELSGTTEQIATDFEHMQKVVVDVIRGDFGNGIDRINDMTAAGEDWAKAQALVDYIWERNGHTWNDCSLTLEEMTNVIGNLSEEELKSIGYTQEQIDAFKELARQAQETGTPINELIENLEKPSGKELLIDSLRNAIKGLITVMDSIKGAWSEVFPPEDTANGLYKIIEAIHSFSERLNINEEKADQLKRTFKGLFAILDLVRMVVGGGLSIAFKILKAIFGAFNMDVLEGTATVGDAIVKFRDWVKENDYLTKAIQFVVTYITKAVSAVKDWVKNNETLTNGFKQVVEFVKNAGISIKDWIAGIKEADDVPGYIISGLVNGLKNGAGAVWDAIISLGQSLIDKIKEILGIHSPSTVFMAIGGFIIAGLILGLTNSFPDVWNAIKEFGSGLKNSFNEFDFSTVGSNVTEGIGSILTNIIDSVKNFNFGNVLAGSFGIGSFALAFKSLDIIDNVTEPIGEFGEMLEEVEGILHVTKKGLKKNMSANMWKTYSDVVLNMAKAIGIVAASLWVVSKIQPDGLKRAGIVVGIIAGVMIALMVYMDLMNKKSKGINPKDTLDTAAKTINISGILMALAGSLLIVSMAIKKLSKIPAEQMTTAIAGFVAMVLGMAVLLAAFGIASKYGDPNAIDKCGTTFLKMAGAILIMSVAIKILGKMDPTALGTGVLAVIALSGIIVGLMAVTKLITGSKHVDTIGSTLMKIAGAILIMGILVKILGGMDPTALGIGVLAVIALSGIIVGLMAVTKLITGSKHVDTIGSTLMKIAGAILIMGILVKILGGMDPTALGIGVLAVIALSGIIVGLMAATKLITGSKHVDTIGTTLLAIAGAILIMGVTAKILGGMNFSAFAQGIAGVFLLSGIVSGLMFIVKKFGKDAPKIGLTLMSIAGAILILSLSVIMLGFMDLASLAKGVGAVAILGGIMAGLMATAQCATGSVKVIQAITIAIVALAAAVIILSFIDPTKLFGATAAVSIILAMLALVLTMSQFATGSVAVLITITATIVILGLIIKLLADLPVESVLGAAIGLSALLLAMAAVMMIIGMISKACSITDVLLGVVALLAICIPLLALVGILALMQGISNATQNAILLSTMALVLTVLLIPLTIVGAFIYPALLGVLALTAMCVPLLGIVGVLALMQGIENATQNANLLISMMGALTEMLIKVALVAPLALMAVTAIAGLEMVMTSFAVLAVAIGALMTKFPALEDFLSKGIDVLVELGNGIGRVLGAFIAGFSTEVMPILPALGESLSGFMTNVTPFIEGMKLVDSSVLIGVGILSASIIALTAAELIAGITSFLSGQSFADLGMQLSQFMINAMPFILGLQCIDESSANAAKALADTILVLTAADLISGITSWLTGDSSLSDFANEIGPFGTAIKEFSDNVEGINPENVKAASEAGKALAEMAATVPNEGGVAGWFAGENSLANFGDELVAFGTDLVAFSVAVEGINPENVKAAAEAGKYVTEMADTVPNEGGVAGWFAGENSLANFGDELVTFGLSLKTFSDNVEGINPENVKAASEAGKALAEMADTIPNEGGVAGWFAGENSVANFGDEVASFGEDLKTFSDNIEGINPENVRSASTSGKILANMMATISESGVSNVDDFNDLIVDFGTAMKNFQNEIANVNVVNIRSKIISFKSVIDSLNDISTVNLDGLVESFSIAETNITSAIDGLLTAINDKESKFKTAGEDLTKKLVEGIKSKKDDIKKNVYNGKLDDVVSAIKKKKSDFETAGNNLGEGLVNGINDKQQAVRDAAYALGQIAVQGEKDGQQSESPSKLTYQSGIWFGEGLVNGIRHMDSAVYNEGKDLGKTATGGLSKAISKISDVINSDIDTQPTIRPVLDLSGVAAGAGRINGMFDMNPSVGVMANVRSISSTMSKGQNGVNDDVVSALKDLGKQLGSTSGDTYNINGVTYDDGSNVSDAVRELVRAARIERRR